MDFVVHCVCSQTKHSYLGRDVIYCSHVPYIVEGTWGVVVYSGIDILIIVDVLLRMSTGINMSEGFGVMSLWPDFVVTVQCVGY